MAHLKICMMLHYEDTHGDPVKTSLDAFKELTTNIIKISSVYSDPNRNAKLSYQFSQRFSERIIDPDPVGHQEPTYNITTPVALGHNYWTHIHSATLGYAISARHALASVIAYGGWYSEAFALSHIMGSSGGFSFSDPETYDWVTIAHSAGYKVKNSVVWGSYVYVPQTVRPYRHSDSYVQKWYYHRAAPIPYHIDTYRTVYRMTSASEFFLHSDTGSVGIIPHAAPWTLAQLDEGFLPGGKAPTEEDFQYAVSQIVSLANQTVDTETNSFYLMMTPRAIEGDALQTMHANFIDTVNHAVGPDAQTQKAEWQNMNEIWSAFVT